MLISYITPPIAHNKITQKLCYHDNVILHTARYGHGSHLGKVLMFANQKRTENLKPQPESKNSHQTK